jgi:hypothetical protein
MTTRPMAPTRFYSNVGGYDTATGYGARYSNTQGFYNTATPTSRKRLENGVPTFDPVAVPNNFGRPWSLRTALYSSVGA